MSKRSNESVDRILKYKRKTSDYHRVTRSSDDWKKFLLSCLPDEILIEIFSYLPILDLASLSKTDERLAELIYRITEEANFSSCRRDNVELVTSFLTKNRVTYVQKLSFNYYCYSIRSEVVSLICRCKKLTVLSVVECGLTNINISRILKSCTKLEKLACSVKGGSERKLETVSCPNLKQVYIFSPERIVTEKFVSAVANNSPQIENVWIQSPFFMHDSTFPFKFDVFNSQLGMDFTVYSSCSKHFSTGGRVNDRVYNFPLVLQIRSMKEDILSLQSSCPSKVYTTLTIIYCSNKFADVSESLTNFVENIAGMKLKHFSLKNEGIYETADYSLIVCETLEQIFLTSKNITVLSLATNHFWKGSPVRAITQLTNLKTLSIPSCAFGEDCSLRNPEFVNLSDIVSSCPKIENFILYCCCLLDICDPRCMKNWSLLKHFSIYQSFSVRRRTSFLKKVADSCEDLQSFSLIDPNSVGHYTDDVIYLLKKAKKLRFIRINAKDFDPMRKRVWNAIGKAEYLEGICIMTRSETCVETNIVMERIEKLKNLKLFHLFAPRFDKHLKQEVEQFMRKHGIVESRVEVSEMIPDSGFRFVFFPLSHEIPGFSCKSSHFEAIDIF